MHVLNCFLPAKLMPVLYAHGGIDNVVSIMLHLINSGKLPLKNLVVEQVPKCECKQVQIHLSDDDHDLLPKLFTRLTGVRTALLYFMQYEFWTDPMWHEEYDRRRNLQCADAITTLLARFVSEGCSVENIPVILQTAERTLYDYLEGKVVPRI